MRGHIWKTPVGFSTCFTLGALLTSFFLPIWYVIGANVNRPYYGPFFEAVRQALLDFEYYDSYVGDPLEVFLSLHWRNLRLFVGIPILGWGMGRLIFWLRWERRKNRRIEHGT
jgi:hypothetical protein